MVKEEWEKMVKLCVINPADEPTDWISSLLYSWKESEAFRICLYPQDLNDTACHDHHCNPAVAEIAHRFAHSCFSTKLVPDMTINQLSLTMNLVSSQPSAVFSVDIISCTFHLALSAARRFSRRECARSWRHVKDTLVLLITSLPMATLKQNKTCA